MPNDKNQQQEERIPRTQESTGDAAELSDDELDGVAGGLNVHGPHRRVVSPRDAASGMPSGKRNSLIGNE